MKTLAVASILLPASLFAQTVSVAHTTGAPLVARAYSATASLLQQQIVPANQSGPQSLHPQVVHAEAVCTYGYGAYGYAAGTTWHMRADCYEVAPSFAQVTGDVLLQVSATSPVQVNLELVHGLMLSAGAIGPAFSIDFGDDGTFEVSEAGVGMVSQVVQLGPTPLPIRLRASVMQVGIGFVDLSLGIAISPATAQVNPLTNGCTSLASLTAYPVFTGTGVEFTVTAPGPVVLVLGLGLQPQPLPLAWAASCTLLPSPDLLVPLVAPPLPYFTLPLPAAVRPVTLFAQGVALLVTSLGTTNSFSILAN